MKLFSLLSPTYILAGYLKEKYDRTETIKVLNSFYLWVSIVSTISLLIYQEYFNPIGKLALNSQLNFVAIFTWSYFLFSRCNEIFWAFLKDAFEKMDKDIKPSSNLEPRDRIRLSLKSYLELVINFSILYLLLPLTSDVWRNGVFPESITDALYFSGVTITTLGYGDISPEHWWPQFLTVYEVFCGFTLLIVCFAIYAGKLNEKP
ncbi:potassium channel family protein [Pseudoalteromonas sp. CNC9-20]|uniref:potassium channel family protein n=1 Tax=Pseudoalteromonas sp. CNC9-20 TaxID=2917750 RepID=UPI001EF5E1B6|nr:potassium channel family protein [Pseudoalteromonas sp. CNC9-20]MCG7568452.1 potassium channel family protein [Pseudoalteromonas sp. CNC9-20]